MSDFTIVLLLMGLILVAMYVWFSVDKLIERRADAIVTGVLEGVAIPIEHRRYKLVNTWTRAMGAAIGYQTIMAIGGVVLARTVSGEEVQTFAYLVAFFSAVGAVTWIEQGIVGYFRLSSVLRKAEQAEQRAI